ncbi:unnamed protein product [Ostreobium quekettii]|uniref:Uncharacterized protein n=1 Tax=Ostreobium quekettii TaxID=121088 RepID=A0A8S1IWL4_9CHLO|nr:unnamed protein product [Ostreobium quekettii]|eukprot:evm.model.scf_237.2 EVM.evm.TU.scf_237.2   scf_237:15676-16614(-)
MDSWESYGSPFGEGSDVSRSVKCEQSEIAGRSAGRAGARGEGRQACEEAVREAARVEASVWRLLGGGGGGHYDGMDFWELQRVGETFRELDLPDNERALQQALWRREALHSMVVAAARQGDGLGPSDGSQCAGSLGLPPCNANCSPPCRFLGMPEVPQLRYGFEFADVESLGDHRKSPLSSKQVFFAGSLFKVMLSVATKKASNQKMLGIFFHRDSSFKGRLGDANGFVDPRAKIDVSITIIVGNAEQEGIGLKGSLQSPRSNLGYSTLLPFGDLRRYLSPSGTLRVSVILSHLFDTADKPDGSHTSTPRIV